MSELRTGFTFNKRQPDAWTVDVLDGYGVVCSVPAAGPDDGVAEGQARRIAAALGGPGRPEVDVAQRRNDDEVSVALQQVYARIAEKRGMVVRLSLAAERGASFQESRRLTAKAEGMSVAASYVDEAIRSLPAPSAGTVQPGAQRPTADLATKTIVLHYASDGAVFTLGDWTLIAPPGTTPEQADALLAAALGSSEGEDEHR